MWQNLLYLFYFRQRQKQNKQRRSFGGVDQGRPAYLPHGQFAPRAVGPNAANPSIKNAHQEIIQQRQQAFVRASGSTVEDNLDAAAKLRAMLRPAVTYELDVFIFTYYSNSGWICIL